MSYAKVVTLHCEGNCFYGDRHENGATTVKSAREEAKRDGWTYKNGKDFCPSCSGTSKERI